MAEADQRFRVDDRREPVEGGKGGPIARRHDMDAAVGRGVAELNPQLVTRRLESDNLQRLLAAQPR